MTTAAIRPAGRNSRRLCDGSRPTVAEFEDDAERRSSSGSSTSCTPIRPPIPFIVLLLGVAVFSVIVGGSFFAPFNLSLILQQVTIIGILGIAQTLVILTAGIDLSVGAIMVLSLGRHGPARRRATACRCRSPFSLRPRSSARSAAASTACWSRWLQAAAVHRHARHLEHLLAR